MTKSTASPSFRKNLDKVVRDGRECCPEVHVEDFFTRAEVADDVVYLTPGL